MRVVTAFCLCLLASPVEAAPLECETYWLYYGGKEDPEYLRISESWPLERFTKMQPWWYYGSNEQGLAADSQVSQLQWRSVSSKPEVRNLGSVRRLRVYEIVYSPLERAIVWSRGGNTFCAALLASADASIVAAIHDARTFRWQGRDIVHVRIQFQGTGHFQESVFLAAIDGRLRHLRADERNETRIRDFYTTHRIRPFHRGLGFCEGQLVEQDLFEAEAHTGAAALCIGCRVVITYSVQGDRLTVDRLGFAKVPESDKDCEMFASR